MSLKLLCAVGFDQTASILVSWAGGTDIWEENGQYKGHWDRGQNLDFDGLEDLVGIEVPTASGLYVWEGEASTTEKDSNCPEYVYEGKWRHAGVEEITNYVKGNRTFHLSGVECNCSSSHMKTGFSPLAESL